MNKADAIKGKKEEILDAAEEVFAVSGFASARVSDIADAAGVAKGTIYLYFASKQELFVSLLEARVAELIQRLNDAMTAGVQDLSHFIHVIATVRGEWLYEHRRLLASVPQSLPQFPQALVERLDRLRREDERQLVAGLAKHLPPGYPVRAERVGDILLGALMNCLKGMFLESETPPLDEIIRDLEYVLLPGLLNSRRSAV